MDFLQRIKDLKDVKIPSLTIQLGDGAPRTFTIGPVDHHAHPYISLTLDILKFAISFFVASYIPGIIAWVDAWYTERNTPELNVEFPAVS